MPDLSLSSRLTLHYLDENPQGSRCVLLLHGLGATCESWMLQIPDLVACGFRVIAPDLRGFGDSTTPRKLYRIEDMSADMAALLAGLGIQKASLVGISMGGTVALGLLYGYAQFIEKAILVNTFARLRPARPADFFYYASRIVLLYAVGLQAQAKAVANHIFPKPDQEPLRQLLIEEISKADPAGYRAAFTALARFNLTAALPRVTAPTLVVTAANDTTVPLSVQNRLAAGIRGARHVIIPDAGHAVTVDQPAAFNRIMLDFLLESAPLAG